MDLEIVIQSEERQKEKNKYCIISLHGKPRNMVQINLFEKLKQNYRCKEQSYGYQVGKRRAWWGELKDWN